MIFQCNVKYCLGPCEPVSVRLCHNFYPRFIPWSIGCCYHFSSSHIYTMLCCFFSSHLILEALPLNASAAARSVDWKSIIFSPRSKIFVSFGDERVPLSHNFNILLSHFPQMTISEILTLNPAQDVQCFQSDNLTIWHPKLSFWFCVLIFLHLPLILSDPPTRVCVCSWSDIWRKKSPCKYL